MAAPKRDRDPIIFQRDLAVMLDMRLKKKRPGDILKAVNAVRIQEAYEAAIAEGMPEAEARRFGKAAAITDRTLRRDMVAVKKIQERLNVATADALLLDRLRELEIARQTLLIAERECWTEFERSRQEDGKADPQWMARIESAVWRQVLIGREMFQLQVNLGQRAPDHLIELAKSGDASAAEQLRAHEVAVLYSAEGRAAGLDPAISRARFQAVAGFLEAKNAGSGGTATKVVFEIRGLAGEESS